MNQKVNPFFTVVIPVYNNEDFLAETLQSVIDQTFDNWEAIIIDDGSEDNCLNLANSIAEGYKNIIVLTHPEGVNRGVSASRNLGIENAKGEWIAFLDADDIWYENRLHSHFEIINSHDENTLAFVYSKARIIDEKGNYIEDKSDVRNYNIKFGIHGSGKPGLINNGFKWVVDKGFEASTPSVTVKTETIRNLGGFNEELTYSEDAIMWYRIIENSDFYFIDQPLLNIRVHNNSWNAVVSNELKICRRFNAYEFLIDKVKEENREYIYWLLVNKGFRIIARSFSGYPNFNYSLMFSKMFRIFRLKSIRLSLKFYSIFVLVSELILMPIRVLRNLLVR